MAIEIFSEAEEAAALDFNIRTKDGREMTLTLPVLGSSNIPLGMMATITPAMEAMGSGSEQEMSRALYGLLESMKGQFPEQYRMLWSMDWETAMKVFSAWFDASKDQGGFDPKASSITH